MVLFGTEDAAPLLAQLSAHFGEVAVPAHGRYVQPRLKFDGFCSSAVVATAAIDVGPGHHASSECHSGR